MPFSDWMSVLGPSISASVGAGVGLRGPAAFAAAAAAPTASADTDTASANRHREASALRLATVQSVERADGMTSARTADWAPGCAAGERLTEI
jgi:hypothetical protein